MGNSDNKLCTNKVQELKDSFGVSCEGPHFPKQGKCKMNMGKRLRLEFVQGFQMLNYKICRYVMLYYFPQNSYKWKTPSTDQF